MSDRWARVEALRKLRMGKAITPTGQMRAVATPIAAPVVHKPDTTVWTVSAEGLERCWHVSASGALHETAESKQWVAERGAAS